MLAHNVQMRQYKKLILIDRDNYSTETKSIILQQNIRQAAQGRETKVCCDINRICQKNSSDNMMASSICAQYGSN